ncbi:MAG TPA: hypothetical protein VGJ69_01820 [Pyrinomonadaceae bacterium]|jgi:hypothetical protein
MKAHRGVSILVFGILGLVLCQLFGIAAWTMGNADLKEMDEGRMDSGGRDLTKAGRICGMVATGILIFQFVVFLIVIVTLGLTNRT